MAEEIKEVQNFLSNEITFTFKSDIPEYAKYVNDEFCFKIPSVADRIAIEVLAGRLRREADPDGNGTTFSQHPAAVTYVENVATFQYLLRKTNAKWALTTNDKGKPVIDWTKISDDAPVSAVVEQFNQELDKFRANGNQS